MTAGPSSPEGLVDEFVEHLLGMSYSDPDVRALLDLEGLTQWLPGRVDGYSPLERAVDEAGFYSGDGQISATNYRP